MTNMSPEEFDEYIKKTFPTVYEGNGVTINLDMEWKCYYVVSKNYQMEWYWQSKRLQIFTNPEKEELFCSRIEGRLDYFCKMDGNKIYYSSEEDFENFCKRLLGIRVFQ